jgi:hypothetical protein
MAPGGGAPGGGGYGAPPKPITGSPETIAMHAMTIDPKTGLPRGERPPATTAAVVSFVCGILLCLGPLTGFVAIVAGVIARRAARERPHAVGGGTMGAIGIALGVLNLFACAIVVLVLILRAVSP